ncbi:type II toxin-antitoxin system PemK/MazF family toxin, partial [Candidatus Chloroploca sp. Khr17]
MSNVIKTRLVKIGNSQGIRIPKVLLDQIRTVDQQRLRKRLGRIDHQTQY